MSIRNNPFEEIERFFQRMSRQIEDASDRWGTDEPFGLWPPGIESMTVDLVEHADEFVATVDLPGFERDEVDVRVSDQALHVDAEHEESTEEEEEAYLRRERRHESLHRAIRLPADVETEGVTARMKNGVLTITLPKVEIGEARTIEIE